MYAPSAGPEWGARWEEGGEGKAGAGAGTLATTPAGATPTPTSLKATPARPLLPRVCAARDAGANTPSTTTLAVSTAVRAASAAVRIASAFVRAASAVVRAVTAGGDADSTPPLCTPLGGESDVSLDTSSTHRDTLEDEREGGDSSLSASASRLQSNTDQPTSIAGSDDKPTATGADGAAAVGAVAVGCVAVGACVPVGADASDGTFHRLGAAPCAARCRYPEGGPRTRDDAVKPEGRPFGEADDEEAAAADADATEAAAEPVAEPFAEATEAEAAAPAAAVAAAEVPACLRCPRCRRETDDAEAPLPVALAATAGNEFRLPTPSPTPTPTPTPSPTAPSLDRGTAAPGRNALPLNAVSGARAAPIAGGAPVSLRWTRGALPPPVEAPPRPPRPPTAPPPTVMPTPLPPALPGGRGRSSARDDASVKDRRRAGPPGAEGATEADTAAACAGIVGCSRELEPAASPSAA